jgi:hypothetical protein
MASKKFDLAIAPVTQDIVNRLLDDDKKIYTMEPKTIADADDTYDGADVFILGYPGLVGEEYQQRALTNAFWNNCLDRLIKSGRRRISG